MSGGASGAAVVLVSFVGLVALWPGPRLQSVPERKVLRVPEGWTRSAARARR